MTDRFRLSSRLAVAPLLLAMAGALACPPAAFAQPNARQVAPPGLNGPGSNGSDAATIVAIVNGDVITRGDVANRTRLFALSTGMPASPDVLERLKPQVTRQLIDERLELQETQRRKIVVTDKEIAAAIDDVEKRNNLPPGALRHKLSADNVDLRTLIDQLRVQIGWARVLRQVMQGGVEVSDADVAEQASLFKAETGQTEYRVGEIFVPVSEPSRADEAKQFSDTVIQQLRAGAPFAIVAAQFSQSQTALQGGDLGWVDQSQLDPDVLRVVKEMPIGAVSNPIRVPGGYSIVTLRAKREIGRDMATMLSVRQVFYPFATRLDPANPTEQQKQALEASKRLSANAKSCADMEEAQKKSGSDKPADPGEIRLETVAVPALRQVLGALPPGKPSQPLIAEDGIAVIMICSREEKNLGVPTRQELSDKIVNERAELASRQLVRDLERRAVIDRRS
jgi:peptidyl-prolyl cis-trans isomerase SurA